MNKTESARFIEDVQGIIIGDYTVTARLISKRTGNENGRGEFANDQAAREWAVARVAELKRSLGDEYKRLFGEEGFELRLWD